MYRLNEDYETMYKNIVTTLAKYIQDSGLQSLVIGISGGIDSALVAVLAHEAIRASDTGIPLIGRSITIESNKPEEIERARLVGEQFCDNFKELDLTQTYMKLIGGPCCLEIGQLDTGTNYRIAMGNIKARLRMIQLYHLAGINKGMVLSTDNYTELLLGFWTLHGDVGDYGMVQNLWKTEVYGLSRWIMDEYNIEGLITESDTLLKCIRAVPTDGLGITDSDLDQLGAKSYNEVDEILINYLNTKDDGYTVQVSHPVIARYEATHFKRENPYNIPRKELLL